MTQRRGQVFDVPTKQFNGLPEEIKFLIFMAMDVRTLVLSRLVCRSWKISIDSPSLEYKIELAVSGVTEGPPRTHEIGKRTDLLKGHRAAWRNLVWHELTKIPAAPHMPYTLPKVLLRDNVLAQKGQDDFHILVASIVEEENVACISVYDLPSHTPAHPHADEETNRCAFLLPEVDSCPVFVRCCPSSARQSVLSYSHPEDLPDSIVTITAFCNPSDLEFDSALKITAPASRLRRLIADAVPGQRFAWHEWHHTVTHAQVDTGTVIGNGEPRYIAAGRFDYISGMRSVKLTEDFSRLCVYDFSPLRVSRYIHTMDREASEVPEDNPSRDIMFVDWNARALHVQLPVFLTLPTAGDTDEEDWPLPVVQTSIELPEKLHKLDLVWSNVLITDDAIVILDPAPLGFVYIMRF
ncbi:hypothetical protein EWM64_g4877 [Hericium alpestre]|uniref:F-box domain-containing protein n=1 Tax=Hericium alpestre TaxID=135208 RepID=A0A4Y9ZWD6_9AGAM|nr:hypothetical protein EWM64_g4877 [Hericium alpestre]